MEAMLSNDDIDVNTLTLQLSNEVPFLVELEVFTEFLWLRESDTFIFK